MDVSDHRRDRDEVPAGCLHVRGRGLQASPHSVQVDVDDAIPIGRSGRADRLQRAQDTGAGDDDVDRAEVLGDLAEDLLLSFEVADVDGLAGQVEPHRVSLMVMTTLPLPPPAWRIGLSASRNSRTAGTNRSWYWKMPPCPESG